MYEPSAESLRRQRANQEAGYTASANDLSYSFDAEPLQSDGYRQSANHLPWTLAADPYASSIGGDPFSGYGGSRLGSTGAIGYSASAAADLGYASSARPDFGYAHSVAHPGGVGTRPLNVIHVGQYMFRAGIESWLKALIRHSDANRIRFRRLVVTSRAAQSDVIAEMGVPVEIGGAESVRQAAADCDVLLCSGPADVADWIAQTRPKLCLFVAHGESPWTREILDPCGPVADHIVAVSDRVRQLACDGLPTTVIYNGVDLGHLVRSRSRREVRESLGFAEGDFVFGYVGRFSPEKRPHHIIESIESLPRHFKVLMVGWGPLEQPLVDLANQRIPGRYAFVRGDRHLGDYYQAMDAFGLASQWEGFGLVLLEAMFSELPVISGPVGFIPECLEDRIHCLVTDGTSESIREGLVRLERYPDWSRGLARQGRAYAEQHGHARRMAAQYADLIEKLWREKHGQLPSAC